jgi:hypothetical protein
VEVLVDCLSWITTQITINAETAKPAEKCIFVEKRLVLRELCVFCVQRRDQY